MHTRTGGVRPALPWPEHAPGPPRCIIRHHQLRVGPRASRRRLFLEAYARANGEVSVSQLQTEMRAALPLAHCVWGLWALCALPEAIAKGGARPFSHIEYAERRLRAFDAALSW